jgi:hypothetical protein
MTYAVGDFVVDSGIAYSVLSPHTAAFGGVTQPSTDTANVNYKPLGQVSSKFAAYETMDPYVAERVAGASLKVHESDKGMLRRGRIIG